MTEIHEIKLNTADDFNNLACAFGATLLEYNARLPDPALIVLFGPAYIWKTTFAIKSAFVYTGSTEIHGTIHGNDPRRTHGFLISGDDYPREVCFLDEERVNYLGHPEKSNSPNYPDDLISSKRAQKSIIYVEHPKKETTRQAICSLAFARHSRDKKLIRNGSQSLVNMEERTVRLEIPEPEKYGFLANPFKDLRAA